MNVEGGNSLEKVGDYNNYPQIKENNNSYFNIMNIL